LDLRLNQLYVDSPTLAEVLLPVTLAGQVLAVTSDACFVNPWYFWSDVRVGRGTAYFYSDPVTPENVDPDGFPPSPGNTLPGDTVPDPGEPPPANITAQPKEAEPVATAPVAYTVQSGDTLASISRRYYGRPHHWKRIYMANQNVLTSADALRPGQVIAIPATP
jgi:LysM repeat protein